MGLITINRLFKSVKNKLKKQLSDNDKAQAQIMGMALAGLKAAEVNAQLIVKQNLVVESLQQQLLTTNTILAHYTVAAGQAKDSLDKYEEGTIEYEAMLLMASELYQVAEMIQGMEKKEGVGNEEKLNH